MSTTREQRPAASREGSVVTPAPEPRRRPTVRRRAIALALVAGGLAGLVLYLLSEAL